MKVGRLKKRTKIIAGLVFVSGLVFVFFVFYKIFCEFAEPVSNHPYFNPDEFLVFAHRGARGLGPENTLYTYRMAVNLDVNVLEMDIRSTRDGQLIILHGRDVARTTNATGPVENFTLEELKQLDAAFRWSPDNGKTFPLRGRGIRIPTLAEVFGEFRTKRMNLEIKDARLGTIHSLCQSIRKFQMTSKVMVAAFNDDSLRHFRSLCPQVATSAGSSEAAIFFMLQKARLEGAYAPDFQAVQVPEYYGPVQVVDKRFIEAAHSRNIRVHVWTVNETDAMIRLMDLGVDGMMTDYPQRLIAAIKNRTPRP